MRHVRMELFILIKSITFAYNSIMKMRVVDLKLKNIRIIGENFPKIDFSPAYNVTIFLGNNGRGKTTILDSIALLISPFISQFPSIPDKMISEWDVHRNREGRLSDFLELKANFLTNENVTVFEARTKKGLTKAPESDLKEIKQLALDIKEKITAGSKVEMPVFAYYGTGRGQINAPERKRNFQKSFERWDCYNNALTPSTDFKSFFAWFDLMEDEERRQREKLRNFDYRLPALEAVRNALENFVGDKFQSPRIELHPLRFVMTERNGISHERTLRIEQMSDGYKIIIAMVADIASRMAEANPSMSDPLLTSGIILIDEIDLHLHPKWQRIVVGQLTKTFPNIQFILTTHSPIIIAGASEKSQIIHLDAEDSSDSLNICQNLAAMDIGQILLSELFGLKSLRSPMWDKKITRRNELLEKAQLNNNEQEELSALNDELSVLPGGDTPNEIIATKLLGEIASNLGIKL